MGYLKYLDKEFFEFEKIIRRKPKELEKKSKFDLFSREERELINSQIFGSIHTIEDDTKIPNFKEVDDYFRIKARPGVVLTPPTEETNFETQWAPMSSKVFGRNPYDTIILFPELEDVRYTSVILLFYRCWFKFKTLSRRKGKLSEKKKDELRRKLEKLEMSLSDE